MKREDGGEVYCESERYNSTVINAFQTISITSKGNKSSDWKKAIQFVSPAVWERLVIDCNVRERFMFVVLGLLDRSGGKPTGKGLNRYDYRDVLDNALYASVMWIDAERLRMWIMRFCKYRKQLSAMGKQFPECLFVETEC